jgi:two-component system LytT family sensor kinase
MAQLSEASENYEFQVMAGASRVEHERAYARPCRRRRLTRATRQRAGDGERRRSADWRSRAVADGAPFVVLGLTGRGNAPSVAAMTPGPHVSWRFAVALTALLTVLFAIQSYASQDAASFAVILQRQIVVWGIWLLLTPWVIETARKYPIEERVSAAWVRKQLVIGGAFAVVHSILAGTVRKALGVAVYDSWVDVFVASIVTGFGRNYLAYGFIAAAYQALLYHRTMRERDAEAARLELDLMKAKLETLEGRIRPHFLFNTLNAIAALVREDPAAAETMIGQLSELLRASLRADPTGEVRLAEELDLVEQYLAIQQVRFQDRLHVTVAASEAVQDAMVPQLILQPIVENAVRHGIAPRETGGTIAVRAERVDSRLRLTVEDDGVGFGKAPPELAGNGIGLGVVRSRLTYLYGSDHVLEVSSRKPSGTLVTIELPYHSET